MDIIIGKLEYDYFWWIQWNKWVRCFQDRVCNIRLIEFNSSRHYLRPELFPSARPFYYPSYTPTPMSPYRYADNCISPCPSYWPHLFSPFPSVSYQFSQVRAWAVPSLPHPSTQVAAKCAPLCPEGRGGSGY